MILFFFVSFCYFVHSESQLLTLGLTAGVENGNAVISQPYASVVPVSGGGMYSPMGYGMSPGMGMGAMPGGMYGSPAMMPYYGGYPSMSYGASPMVGYAAYPAYGGGYGGMAPGYPAGYSTYGGSPPSRPGPVRQFLRGATEGMMMSTLGIIGRK